MSESGIDMERCLRGVDDEATWLPIEEFKNNPIDGYAWAKHLKLDKPIMVYVKDSVFYVSGSFQDSNLLTHVMSIAPPEDPK